MSCAGTGSNRSRNRNNHNREAGHYNRSSYNNYTAVPTPQTGGRLRMMITAGPGSPIGWPAESVGPSLVYTKPCIESLLFEDTNGQIKPWLATEWKIAHDQKSITFTLRKDVKFHDGSDFNAQAVKFNLEASKNAKKSGTDIWTSLEVIDDYTFRSAYLQVSKYNFK